MRVSQVAALVLLAFAGVFMAGCLDNDTSTSPMDATLSPAPEGPNFAAVDPSAFLDELKLGTFTVCKVIEKGSTQQFTFNTTAVGPGVSSAPVYKPTIQLGEGECDDVYVAPAGFDPDVVTITEVVPSGWKIDKIAVYSLEEKTGGGLDTLFWEYTGTATVEGSVDKGKIGCLVIYYNSEIPDADGCTPGYWKNHIGSWPATGYLPGNNFDSTFGVTLFGASVSLCDALNQGGGGDYALGRHAVAALLSSSHPDVSYGLSLSEILDAVEAGDKGTLSYYNEMGCPIGGPSENGKCHGGKNNGNGRGGGSR